MNVYYDVEDNHYRTYPDGDIATIDQMRELVENKNLSIVKLQQENKQLKDNWIKLKEFMSYENIGRLFDMGYDANDFINEIDDKIKELEQGADK